MARLTTRSLAIEVATLRLSHAGRAFVRAGVSNTRCGSPRSFQYTPATRSTPSLFGLRAKTSSEKSLSGRHAYSLFSSSLWPGAPGAPSGLENAEASSGSALIVSVMKVVSLPIITKVFQRQPCFQSWRATCGGGFSQKRLTRATSPPSPIGSSGSIQPYADSARSGVMPNSRIRPGRSLTEWKARST